MSRPNDQEIVDILKKPNPDLQVQAPSDMIDTKTKEPDIDKRYLSEYLMKVTKSDIHDRETFGFNEKLQYAIKAYYGLKDEFLSNWPWPNASNFIEPIIPTLLDTGQANIQNSMFRNPMKTINVRGIAPEDRPNAPKAGAVMNWQVGAESNMYEVQDINSFRTLKDGTGFVKTWIDIGDEFKLKNSSVPVNLIYKPLYSTGCQRDTCDHITQFIPLNYNDMQFRMGLKIKGNPVYDGLDHIKPGLNMVGSLSADETQMLDAQVTGFDITAMDKRDLYYLAETHLTFYPKGSFKAIELIVWWSVNTGKIHRMVENKDLIRPYADYWIYQRPGFAFHESLPEKLRDIQEKANYIDKQVTDAADKAISEPGYITEGSGFNPNENVRVPTGMYEVKKGTTITFEQTNMAPIIERSQQIDRLWDKAERKSMFTDLFQGRQSNHRETLGQTNLRNAKSEKRFRTVLDRYGLGWKKTCDLIYFYDDKYMPRPKMARILGSTDYFSLGQLFPKSDGGMGFNIGSGKFDFTLAGSSQDEVDQYNSNVLMFTDKILNSAFGQDKAVAWNCLNKQAEIIDFLEFDRIVPRPAEADKISIEEVFQRIESGETDIQPSPFADAEYQRFRILSFARTENFQMWTPEKKQALDIYLKRVDAVGQGQKLAKFEKDAQGDPQKQAILEEIMQSHGQMPAPRIAGNPGKNGGIHAIAGA